MRLTPMILATLLVAPPLHAQSGSTCEPFQGQFQYCPIERTSRGGTLIVPFLPMNPQVALFAVDRGIGQVYSSRFDLGPADAIQAEYVGGIEVVENLRGVDISGDAVIGSFAYSGQNDGDLALSPRIVTLLNFDGTVVAVATNFPNPLAQDNETQASDIQLRAHQDLVTSIRPLPEN